MPSCTFSIFEAVIGCHAILILGKSPMKRKQRNDMTLAVDWDVKHQFKQTNKPTLGFMQYLEHLKILEYLLGVELKGVGMQMVENQFLMSSKVLK